MAIIVSDAAAEESLQAYTNPLSIQEKALDELSEKVLNGDVVGDGNNPFTFLTEFSSNMTAELVNKACDCFNHLYPENAQTATELYKHLSDFDYIGLYSTPATTMVEIVFDRNFLIDNAVNVTQELDINDEPDKMSGAYSKIVIPQYSKFTIGDYVFGLMYPIEIRIRKAIINGQINYQNSVITVSWDTTYKNPLMALTGSILEHRDFVRDGQALTAIAVPIYQFEVQNHVENSVSSTGFSKRYSYSNRFYAARIFHYKNGMWNEMKQSFSDTNYDVDIPTAIVKVLQDIGKVEVVIPHIYFNSNNSRAIIGNRILIKIYTTLGELNVDLSEYQVNQFQASFLLNDTNLIEDDTYSNMLKRIPTIYILPLSNKIASGTNGITFADLKTRVKYNNSFTVKITPDDLTNYYKTSGYEFTKELDNITDRVYCAHKVITNKDGLMIASGPGISLVSTDMLDSAKSSYTESISRYDENTFTLLPSAIYRYDEEDDRFHLLSDTEKNDLLLTDIENKVKNFNETLYTFSPFHTVLTYANNTPIAGTYDLFNPLLKNITFLWENQNVAAGMSIYNSKIEYTTENIDNRTSNGYRLSISLFRTDNLYSYTDTSGNEINIHPTEIETNGMIKNIQVLLTTYTDTNEEICMLGRYGETDSAGHDIFYFDLPTKYKIKANGSLDLDSFISEISEGETEFYVPIKDNKYILSFFIKDDILDRVFSSNVSSYAKASSPNMVAPDELADYTLLCQQEFVLRLGEELPLLQNNITITTTDQKYKTYGTTQFATYQAPIYDRYTVEDVDDDNINKVGMIKIEKDEDGVNAPVIKHNIGDVIVSSPYRKAFNQSISIQIINDTTKALEYEESLQLDVPTASSSENNTWTSFGNSLFVTCKSIPDYSGLYELENSNVQKLTDRKWVQSYEAIVDKYDTRSIVFDLQDSRLSTQVAAKFSVAIFRSLNDDSVEAVSYRAVIAQYLRALESITFYSCNSDYVKNSLKNIDSIVSYNTSAVSRDRKWYLITDDEGTNDKVSFDFVNNTGFVIEYTKVGSMTEGLEEAWSLNYHYYTTNNLGRKEHHVEMVASYIDYSASDYPEGEYDPDRYGDDFLTDDQKDILKNDAYRLGKKNIYHYIAYDTDNNKLIMYEKADDDSIIPVFEANYYLGAYAKPCTEPYEVKWVSSTNDTEPTSVAHASINTGDMIHNLKTINSLEWISDQIGDSAVEYDRMHRIVDMGYELLERSEKDNHVIRSSSTYYTRTGAGTEENKFVYTAIPSSNLDKYFNPNEEEYQIPVYREYEQLEDALDGRIFVVGTRPNPMRSMSCNEAISYSNDEYEVSGSSTEDLDAALYIRDYSFTNYDLEDLAKRLGLTLSELKNTITDICRAWERKTVSESEFYKTLAKTYKTWRPEYIKQIVSDTQSCYFFPWKKIIGCKNLESLRDYLDYLKRNNKVAGYASVLSTITYDENEQVEDVHYVNFLSTKSSKSDDIEICLDPDISWIDIDKWPWEYDTPWICVSEKINGDILGASKDNLSIVYRKDISSSKILHDAEDAVLDENGNPVVDDGRAIIYGIDMIHCDYKLSLAEDDTYKNYADDIRNLLRAYFNELKSITPTLLARTKLYFSPIRTFGNSLFKGSGTEIRNLPVQFSMELGLHIESYVSESILRKDIIRDEILKMIHEDISDGSINLSLLAKTIMNKLNDDIIYVDVLGINGDKTLQTMLPVDDNCYPQLKQILVLNEDGTIHADSDLKLDWYVIN